MLYHELDEIKTPCYLIDERKFVENVNQILEPFRARWKGKLLLGYSVKTNHNQELMRMARKMKMIAETVSDDEYQWAEKVGFSPKEIIYNGVQKSEQLLLAALCNGSIVNLDNLDEIQCMERHKEKLEKKEIRIGLRINFDLEKECLGETTAGEEVSRFGFCVENGDFEQAIDRLNKMGLQIEGLHLHYSSKTRSQKVFSTLAAKACEIVKQYKMQESIRFLDMGGGFFGGQKVAGKPSMDEYAKSICGVLHKTFSPERVLLILEPGASILATAIDYISRVIQVKEIRGVRIVTVDGSNLHINPFLAAREPKYKLLARRKEKAETQIICGATCMENDRLIKLKDQTCLEKGDIVYCTCAGAYTMAFNNCFINLPPYIYVRKQGKFYLCREPKFNWLEDNL